MPFIDVMNASEISAKHVGAHVPNSCWHESTLIAVVGYADADRGVTM